jgi:hypothetical protein
VAPVASLGTLGDPRLTTGSSLIVIALAVARIADRPSAFGQASRASGSSSCSHGKLRSWARCQPFRVRSRSRVVLVPGFGP